MSICVDIGAGHIPELGPSMVKLQSICQGSTPSFSPHINTTRHFYCLAIITDEETGAPQGLRTCSRSHCMVT